MYSGIYSMEFCVRPSFLGFLHGKFSTMKPPYETFTFDWLVAPDQAPAVLRPEFGDVECLPYPLAPDLGEGYFQKVELALNMSVFRGVHRFKPAAVGRLIPLAAIEVNFHGPTFMVQVMRGGRILHREARPMVEVLYSPGLDLFRLTDLLNVVPILDGSQSSEMTCLMVGVSVLNQLIGDETVEQLLHAVELTSCPCVRVKPIPLHVSAHLHGAIGASMIGAARRLHCQARVLDYLSALIDVLLTGEVRSNSSSSPSRRRSQAIYEQLVASMGKLPTLDELARQFGCSAKRLNDEFMAEFGKSIYAFVTGYRLDQAHAAILHSDIPLKKLAEQLGYAHFNHFSAAFKKKFGYPPGALRKN